MRRMGGLPVERCRSEAFCSNIRLKKASILAIPRVTVAKAIPHAQCCPDMAPEAALQALIREEIEAECPISFNRFMEVALYCPNLGYYERTQSRIGKLGDYYTSVSVGPLFGRLLA